MPKKLSNQFSYEQELNIIHRYNEDCESSNSIAEDFKVSPSVIMNILKKHNIITRDKKSAQKKLLSDDQINKLCEMYLAGYTANYLSQQFGITLNRTKKYIQKKGVRKS